MNQEVANLMGTDTEEDLNKKGLKRILDQLGYDGSDVIQGRT